MDFTEKCDNTLCRLYAEVGDDVTRLIVVASLVEKLGYSTRESWSIADGLEDSGYIKWRRAIGGGAMSITSSGIKHAQDICTERPADFTLQHHREPSDDDDISCHLQQDGMGSLICLAAPFGENETNTTVCFNCPVGKVYREICCAAISPKILIPASKDVATSPYVEKLYCKTRHRDTTLNKCRTCDLPTAETTQKITSEIHGLFTAHGFDSALRDLENARALYRDGKFGAVIRVSNSCFESTMRICLEGLGEQLPSQKGVSNLWKSVAGVLEFSDLDMYNSTQDLLHSLYGVVTKLGGLRNKLSDAHGNGEYSPDVSAAIAELAINASSTLSTFVVRRFIQKNLK
jgi:hypothetical protein